MPDRTLIHIDAALTTLSLAYVNEGFIADEVCPRVSVKKQSDKFYIYDGANMTEVDDTRARGTESKGLEYEVSTSNYACEPHAMHGMVYDEDFKNADVPLRPEADTLFNVEEVVKLNREVRVASLLQTTGNYAAGNSAAAGAGWNAAATDIEADVITAKKAVKDKSQRQANVIVLPWEVALKIHANTQIRDAKKQITDRMTLLESGLPSHLWGLRVVIAGAAKNTAKKGQTVTFADIWTDSVVIMHLEQNPGLRSRSFCVTFDWGGPVARRFDKPERKGVKLEYEEQGLDEQVISSGSGYLLTNVIV